MSTLKTNTIKNTDDVEMYLAKAWVNFNGTGTVAIRAAGNVSRKREQHLYLATQLLAALQRHGLTLTGRALLLSVELLM